jgi:hypothetical protein
MHILGKEGKYEFCGIYQIFPNKFGFPINSTRVQKKFASRIFNSNSVSKFELDSKRKVVPYL